MRTKWTVRISQDRCGWLTIKPSQIFEKAWSDKTHDGGNTFRDGAFVQAEEGITDVLSAVSREARKSIEGGYPTTCQMNSELAEALFNCDY